MKPKTVFVSVCLVLYCSIQQSAFGQSPPSKAEHAAQIELLAKEYNSIDRKDWKRRRNFCIRLIDEGIISDGTKTSDVRRIFARDLSYHEATNKLPAGGSVRFYLPLKKDPTVQEAMGWTFNFDGAMNGYLQSYHLTNCDK